MYTVVIQHKHPSILVISVAVDNSKDLFTLLFILNNAPDVNAFAVIDGKEMITDLQSKFGWNIFDKFTTEFRQTTTDIKQ